MNKEQYLNYLDYILKRIDDIILMSWTNKKYSNLIYLIDYKKDLKEIENDIYFSNKEKISYFKKNKINKISKEICKFE